MKIYSYFNSSTSFRIRIALKLKGMNFECIPINLRLQEQKNDDYVKLNPSAGVPVLSDGGFVLTQSLAIIDYLDSQIAEPRLLPKDDRERARVLEVALGIACDIHPVNNLRVLQYLQEKIGIDDAQKKAWYSHWVTEGLAATEELLKRHGAANFCFGERPTLADCCLVPQVFNAQRMGCQLDSFSRVMSIFRQCMSMPAFQLAAPSNQPDFVK